MNFLIGFGLLFASVLRADIDEPVGHFEFIHKDVHRVTFVYKAALKPTPKSTDTKDQQASPSDLSSSPLFNLVEFAYDRDTRALKSMDLRKELKWELSSPSEQTTQILSSDSPAIKSIHKNSSMLIFETDQIQFRLVQKKCGESVCIYNQNEELVAKQTFKTTELESILIFSDQIPICFWASLFSTHFFPFENSTLQTGSGLSRLSKGLAIGASLTGAALIGTGLLLLITRPGSSTVYQTPPAPILSLQDIESILFQFYEESWKDFNQGRPVEVQWVERPYPFNHYGEDPVLLKKGRWRPLDPKAQREEPFQPFDLLCMLFTSARRLYVTTSFPSGTSISLEGFSDSPITAEALDEMNQRASRRAIRSTPVSIFNVRRN